MGDEPRLSTQTLKVLSAFLLSAASEISGADVAATSKVASGTLYPILLRLEKAGWLVSRWEVGDPKTLGRPRRRYYRLTAVGAAKARAAFQEFKPVLGSLAWI